MNLRKPSHNKSLLEKYSELLAQAATYKKTEELRIMVMGEFNAGKSSICNALLGRPILPTDIFQTTATINRIRYGSQEEYRVIGYDDEEILRESNLETLNKFNADCGEFENIKWIETCSPLVPHGIEFTDTPGFNDVSDKRNETFLKIAPSADVIIFVCDANQPLRGAELPYIKDYFLSAVARVYFVFNHADAFTSLQRLKVASDYVHSSVQKIIKETADIFESSECGEMAEKLRRINLNQHIFFVSALLSSGGEPPGSLEIELRKTLKNNFDRFRTELYSLTEKKDQIRNGSQIALLIFLLKDRLFNVCNALELINLSDQQNENLKISLAGRLSRQEQKYSEIRKKMQNLPEAIGAFIGKECEKTISNLAVELRSEFGYGAKHVREKYLKKLHIGMESINAGVAKMVKDEILSSLKISLNNENAIDEMSLKNNLTISNNRVKLPPKVKQDMQTYAFSFNFIGFFFFSRRTCL